MTAGERAACCCCVSLRSGRLRAVHCVPEDNHVLYARVSVYALSLYHWMKHGAASGSYGRALSSPFTPSSAKVQVDANLSALASMSSMPAAEKCPGRPEDQPHIARGCRCTHRGRACPCFGSSCYTMSITNQIHVDAALAVPFCAYAALAMLRGRGAACRSGAPPRAYHHRTKVAAASSRISNGVRPLGLPRVRV